MPAALPVDKAPLWARSMLRGRLSCLDGIQQVKGRDSLEELVANHGKGVLVHLVVIQFMPEHLRRHVPEQTTKNKDYLKQQQCQRTACSALGRAAVPGEVQAAADCYLPDWQGLMYASRC